MSYLKKIRGKLPGFSRRVWSGKMGAMLKSAWLPQNGILYILFCIIFVMEPTELRGFGLTVEGLFGSWLGDPSYGFLWKFCFPKSENYLSDLNFLEKLS